MHSLVFHIILQFIPIYGTTSLGSSFSTVSYIVAGYCLLNVCGNFLAGQALYRGMRPYRLMSIHFMAVPLLATALFFPDVPDPIRFIALIIGAFFTSLTPSAVFTLIAKLAEKKIGDTCLQWSDAPGPGCRYFIWSFHYRMGCGDL